MGPGFCTPSRVMLAAQLALWGAAMHTSTALAQLVPSVGAASAPAVDPMERAQRQADNVMRWIKVTNPAPQPRQPPSQMSLLRRLQPKHQHQPSR